MIVNSKLLKFRFVNEQDADFIYELRLAQGQYLNNSNFTRADNKKWLSQASVRNIEGIEYYFIISDKKEDVGVVRVYNINKQNNTFVWGSWILKSGTSPLYPIVSAIMVYDFAFEYLKLNEAILDVRNDNTKVISFHQKTGAKLLQKDDQDTHFVFERNDYIVLKEKYKQYVHDITYEEDYKI
jgi:RimJ/RimL family protein N-acetyltransferase